MIPHQSSGPPSVGCGSTGDPGAQFVTLELGGGCLGHVSNSEDGADDEAENIPGLAVSFAYGCGLLMLTVSQSARVFPSLDQKRASL